MNRVQVSELGPGKACMLGRLAKVVWEPTGWVCVNLQTTGNYAHLPVRGLNLPHTRKHALLLVTLVSRVERSGQHLKNLHLENANDWQKC